MLKSVVIEIATGAASFKSAVAVKSVKAVVMVKSTPSTKADEELWVPIVVVIPGTSADKVTIRKPFRTPISVWGARVRGVVVVPVLADRRRAKLNTDRNLSLGVCGWKRERRQQYKIF